MEASSASTPHRFAGWTRRIGTVSAFLMAAVWLLAGLWKLTDVSGFQLKITQLLVPVALSLPATVLLGASETLAGIMLLRPAWRRLGGLFSTLLLVLFMVYVGMNYQTLRGEDCSCFPWLERAVGPAFFWSDGVMLALSLLAAAFAPRAAALRQLRWAAGGVLALAIVAAAVDKLGPQGGLEAPATITVDGAEYDLRRGPVFLYFFNPTCLHCLDVGIAMSKFRWRADIVGVPTQDPDFVQGFLEDAGLVGRVKLSPDLETLKQSFPFSDVPYAAALDDGEVLERFQFFEQPEFEGRLRELGMIE